MVSATNRPELARALQRHGDDLYRLALLLGRDERQAARAMLLAARRLAQQAGLPDEPALIGALVAALPAEPTHPPRRLPRWAVPPPERDGRAALLDALLRLPRPARLALGLSILRTFEPRQVAAIAGGDEAGVRAQLRDALLALAPHAPIAITPGILSEADAPEACRPTRAALALADPARLADPAVRGHLALCSSCRAADVAWAQLTAAVEETLRGALRDVRLPPELDDDLQAAAREPNELGRAHWLAHPRVRIALVTLPVLALIAFLVWPRGAPALPTGGVALPTAAAPADLVRRAQAQLYAPPPGTSGVWHVQYAMQWFFPDGSFAQLNAGEWDDPAGGRHRLQLVHHSGGGPYEFELANGTESVWYAASENYAGVLYPLGTNGTNLRARFTTTPAQREQMRLARLESGPWAIAANYLRQAAGAELRTWGRQRDPDGRLLQLISFPGVSPLALQPDAPQATASSVTVLLTIDETSGRLREVRELFGAADAEQTARTTWQVTSEETIDDAEAANRAFDQGRAWNGVGSFADQGKLLSPLLPLLESDALAAPDALLGGGQSALWLPNPPAGTAALVLTSSGSLGLGSALVVRGDLTGVYVGGGRQLALRTGVLAGRLRQFPADETLSAPGRQTLLKALPNQGYRALVVREAAPDAATVATQVSAVGYSRAELLAVLETLAPASLALFRQQATLVIEPLAHDAAWQALFGALAEPPQPPAGGARYFVEQVFKRQLHQPDPLADPYHRPPYGGWPERLVQHNWARGTAGDGSLETAALTLDADGATVARQFRSAAGSWDYDALAGRVVLLPGEQSGLRLNEDQYTVLRVLACGGATLQAGSDGARRVILADTDWQNQSCGQPHYPRMWAEQRTAPGPQATDDSPYLADLTGDQLTTVIELGADGRAVRTQVWAGQPDTGVLLEAWERLSEALLAPEQIPAETFSAQPPAARLQASYVPPDPATLADSGVASSLTLTDTLARARSPLFGFAPGPGQPALVNLEAGPPLGVGPARSYPLPNSVFGAMLAEGYAIRSMYSTNTASGLQLFQIYQGDAAELGAYLRAQARWAHSEPQPITIGGQALQGWNVIERFSGMSWLVFERDGTLIAVESPPPELLPVLATLVRLGG